MAYVQLTNYVPQWHASDNTLASGQVIKAYLAGTSTGTNLFTDSSGTSAGTSIALNARGEPEVSGNTVIPYLDDAIIYKLSLYPTQAAADADSGAIWTVDNINPASLTSSFKMISQYGDSLATAITDIGATETTLWIDKSISVTADATVPSNITLMFLHGGDLNVSATKTVTINGPLTAGIYQIFKGAGSVVLGQNIPHVIAHWWGAVGDGVTDDTIPIQAAHDTSHHVFYPPGHYIVTTPIQVKTGQKIWAEWSGRFGSSVTKNLAKFEHTGVGGGIFWYTTDTSTSETAAPSFLGLSMKADYPIRLNDRTKDLSAAVGQPILMRPVIKYNIFEPRVNYVGYGLDMSHVFDGDISDNEFANFDITLISAACDINLISNNRMHSAGTFHVLNVGVGSYGSQNVYRDNDILDVEPAGVMFVSNAGTVRVHQNYMESAGAITGFIEISHTNIPAIFGSNTLVTLYTCDIEANRLANWNDQTGFAYKINPTGYSFRIIDGNSGGSGNPSTDMLTIEGGNLPVRTDSAGFHPFVQYEFWGEKFGKWHGFKTGMPLSDGDKLTVNARSYASLHEDAPNINNSGDITYYDGDSIVLDPSMSASQRWYPPVEDANNVHFHTSNSYTVTFSIKTDSASGDTFQLGRILDGSGGALTNYACTEQYQEYTFTMAGAAQTSLVGVYFTRSTANGNIKIRSLTWTKL